MADDRDRRHDFSRDLRGTSSSHRHHRDREKDRERGRDRHRDRDRHRGDRDRDCRDRDRGDRGDRDRGGRDRDNDRHSSSTRRHDDRRDSRAWREHGREVALPPRRPGDDADLPAVAKPFPPAILREGRGLVPPLDLGRFYAMPSSLFSSLLPRFYAQVRRIFEAELPPAAVTRVIDATGNVGGDVILFRDLYGHAHVDAVELDRDTFRCLRHNARDATLAHVLGRPLPADGGVTAHHGSCVDFLRGTLAEGGQGGTDGGDVPLATAAAAAAVAAPVPPRASFVYFDPPWGGPEYYRQAALVLTLDGLSVAALMGECLVRTAAVVVYKAPVNADLAELHASLDAAVAALDPAAPLPVVVRSHDVHKPFTNAKGNVAYCLHFASLGARPLGPLGDTAGVGAGVADEADAGAGADSSAVAEETAVRGEDEGGAAEGPAGQDRDNAGGAELAAAAFGVLS